MGTRWACNSWTCRYIETVGQWMPKCLNADEKRNRVNTSKSILQYFEQSSGNFLEARITFDETWLHHYDPETSRWRCMIQFCKKTVRKMGRKYGRKRDDSFSHFVKLNYTLPSAFITRTSFTSAVISLILRLNNSPCGGGTGISPLLKKFKTQKVSHGHSIFFSLADKNGIFDDYLPKGRTFNEEY